MAIQKSKKSVSKKKKNSLVNESDLPKEKQLSIGQIYVGTGRHSDDYNVVQIVDIQPSKHYEDRRDSDTITYKYLDGIEGHHFEDENGKSKNTFTKERHWFLDYYGEGLLTIPIDQYRNDVQALINGEKTLKDFGGATEISDSTALMQTQSKEYLQSIEKSMDSMKQHAELIRRGVQIEIEKRKRELELFTDGLSKIVEGFKEQIRTIQKVIATIELYMGVEEEIVQIQEGTPCADPIHIWQRTLYMDEEVGDPLDDMQGLDYESIEEFDKWLTSYSKFYKKKNYEVLIPQSKGIMCLRVRRNEIKYIPYPKTAQEHMINSARNEHNHNTYIILRNGTNLYRIWGKIKIDPKLFPDKKELQDMIDKLRFIQMREDVEMGFLPENEEKEYESISERIDDHDLKYRPDRAKKNINEEFFKYKRHLIMLQGLFDRTDVFSPTPEHINILDTECHDKGLVNFIYEDDIRLTDGRPDFPKWMKEINSSITEGSRVLFMRNLTGIHSQDDYNDHHSYGERFDQRMNAGWRDKSGYNYPDPPNTGVYKIRFYKAKESVSLKGIANCEAEVPDYVKERYSKGYFTKKGAINAFGEKYREKAQYPFTYKLQDEDGYEIREQQIVPYTAIYFNTKDKIRNFWDYYDKGHERKNSISYKIYPDTDLNILNYDEINVEDLDYYLYDRRQRKFYLKMMPVLWKIREELVKEKNQELEFVKGLIQNMQSNNEKISNPKETIWEAIEWWKKKNKWKRYLTEDDAKAWRMIRKRLGLK